jgi:hypothetical protein
VDFLNRTRDAFLGWPVPQACLAGFRRVHPTERMHETIDEQGAWLRRVVMGFNP